jgi:hypothetical protein
MLCKADEQFEPQPLSFEQRSEIARLETVARPRACITLSACYD